MAVGLWVQNIDNNSMQEPAYYIGDLASLVRRIKAETDAPVILGGAALSIMPQEILREQARPALSGAAGLRYSPGFSID